MAHLSLPLPNFAEHLMLFWFTKTIWTPVWQQILLGDIYALLSFFWNCLRIRLTAAISSSPPLHSDVTTWLVVGSDGCLGHFE